MKKLITLALIFASLISNAQKNIFLDQAFWKAKPDVSTIKTEIDKGNDATELSSNAFDAVVFAINNDASNESIIYLLSLKGNEVNKITHDTRTYIFWAANKGNTEVMNFLIKKGAKVNVMDSHGFSPLNFAAANGQANTKVYDILLSNGANLKKDINHDGANALLLAISSDKDFALTNYFISKGLDLKSKDNFGNTAFNYAVKSGDIDLLNSLIKKGVSYNDNAMIMATQAGRGRKANNVSFYQYLETLKINPNSKGINGENALHNIARRPNQIEEIRYFISKGVNINDKDNDGNTAFMNAASSNSDIATLEMLLPSLKNINEINKEGASALAMAVQNNSPEVVEYLIGKGADINVVDLKGDNIAAYLVQSYSARNIKSLEPKMKILESKGLNFSAIQNNGNTLLHLALTKESLELLKNLEHFNININTKNKDGLTVLLKAAMIAKNDEILKYLLNIKADKSIETDMNESAFDLAQENEYLQKNKVSIDFLK